MTEREELTEDERAALESGMCRGGMKALRIIDAHAADRAALVARVRELERQQTGFQLRFDGPPGPEGPRFIESETLDGRSVSLGEWEQDGECWLLKVHVFRSNAAESEVARLREALAAEKAHSADTAAAYAAKSEALIFAEARVRELEADLAATHREYDRSIAAAEAEIATLQYCTCRYCK